MKRLLTALVFSVALVLVGCEDPGEEIFEDFEKISGTGEHDSEYAVGGLDEETSGKADFDSEY